MDINNNQQTNTFTGGMNTDTSDALLKPQEYRKAVNLRPVTNTDSNDGELHLIDGVTHSEIYESFSKIYATTSIRDIGVIIGKRTEHTDPEDINANTNWSINKLQDGNLKCVFGPCATPLGENLSLVTRWESNKNIKLYIADGEHALMSINLMHNDYTGTDHTIPPYSIEYIADIDNNVPQITAAVSNTSGNIKGVVVQYTYVLYKQYGSQTNTAPLTAPISLYNGDEGFKQNEYTNKSIDLSLNYSSSTFDRIKVFRIAYIQNGQQPEVHVIVDQSYSGSLTYTDRGTNVTEVSYAEFISTNGIKVKPLLIESKENTLFCANIEYDQQEVDDQFKEVEVTIEPYSKGKKVLKYTQETISSLDYIYLDHEENFDNYLTGDIAWDYQLWYKNVYDGSPNRFSQFINYASHITTYKSDYTFTAYGEYTGDYGRTLMPGETYRYGVVFYDKKGRKSSVMYVQDITVPKVYTYKDKDGNTIDHLYPEEISVTTSGTDRYNVGIVSNARYAIKKIGIQAHVKFLDDNVKAKCSRYEIVRCERTINDSKIITQGIIGGTSKEALTSSGSTFVPNDIRLATPYMTLWSTCTDTYQNPYRHFDVTGDLVMFASPEIIYDEDNYKKYFETVSQKSVEIQNHYYIPHEAVVENDNNYYYLGDKNNNGLRLYQNWNNAHYENAQIITRASSRKNIDGGHSVTMSYLYPYKHITDTTIGKYNESLLPTTTNIKQIKNYKFIKSPEWDQFDTAGTIRIADDVTPIENFSFLNWYTVNLYENGQFNDYDAGWTGDLVSTGKNGVVLNLLDSIEPFPRRGASTGDYGSVTSRNGIPITVANIINQTSTPYGGNTEASINNSIFYSFGDCVDVSPNDEDKDHIFYDGDCYFGLFVYNSSHAYYSATFHEPSLCVAYAVPLYSRIDLKAVCGDLYPKLTSNKKYYFQDTPASINGYVQENSAYLYNDAYSQTPITDKHVPIDWSLSNNEKFDTRIIYSNEKTNNELIDSWLTFKSANYLDVDTRYGEITNLRLFKNTLMFWQEYATGILSVNERTIIQDANDTNIILGNGDVLQRYDYITTLYGSAKNMPCDTQSNTTLYWWDYNKGEILGYSVGQSAQPLTKLKNISNYIRSNDKQLEPAVTYDQDNKEVLFNVVKDGIADRCLVYNEVVQSFTSLYDLPFKHSIDISDKKYYIQNNKIFLQTKNAQNAVSTNDTYLTPYLKYIVNNNPQYNKVYDIQIVGGTLYDGNTLNSISMQYTTPLKQTGKCDGTAITNREYDFRLNVPRAGKLVSDVRTVNEYGDRLRGKTMQCELWSSSNSTDFSLQYITTKYRMSWS